MNHTKLENSLNINQTLFDRTIIRVDLRSIVQMFLFCMSKKISYARIQDQILTRSNLSVFHEVSEASICTMRLIYCLLVLE